jgi:hypothetical protein
MHQDVWRPNVKMSGMLYPIKDDLTLKLPGIISIPCICSTVCTGQTAHSIKTGVNKHQCQNAHVSTGEYGHERTHDALGHPIPLSNTNILAKKCKCREQPTAKVTDIMLHPENMSGAWTLPV